ncbi:MAG: cytochrome d ubiquinol oxidase subunit II [Anaerolineales bacterium]|nr:cytochrome d ubiquinol oxidase subunit II [Anaerolineales bacterium]
MDLNILWFILIAILYTGFFILEGFDFGVGMLLPFTGKNDEERRVMINTIGPHWDANEVWLLTAGGATFAAFPHWYATLFSGFYLALFVLLVGLILRGVAFEFRSKDKNPQWRNLWDWAIFTGSFLGALLLGVAFGNLTRGLAIDADMVYTGGLWALLNPYALVGGISTVALMLLHGCLFLSLKTTGELESRFKALSKKLWVYAFVLAGLMLLLSLLMVDGFMARLGFLVIIPILAAVLLVLSYVFIGQGKFGLAFGMTAGTIALIVVTHFASIFPNVMISTTNPDFSLTIYNASSSPYTLKVMSIVALIFVPLMLLYQGWTYWTFGRRVTSDPQHLEY